MLANFAKKKIKKTRREHRSQPSSQGKIPYLSEYKTTFFSPILKLWREEVREQVLGQVFPRKPGLLRYGSRGAGGGVYTE